MIGNDPIAFPPIGGPGDQDIYLPVSRITGGGVFVAPGYFQELEIGIHWDDNSIILWDDGTPIVWD